MVESPDSSPPPPPPPSTSVDPMDITEPHSIPESQPQNPKQQKPLSDSDSDSDSDDDEAQDKLELENLETELSSNPANYDAHVKYIKALRKQGDIDKLRQAREAMSELFPLTPSMWQEWTKDEISLGSSGDSFPAIEKLYERGVSDYLSVSLWCDYVNFVQEGDPSVRDYSPAGSSKARDLFERALIAAGLHVAEGSKIWEAYRKYEEAIFNIIPEADTEARDKQLQRIRNVFQRQLSVPHGDLRSTLLVYKAWESEHGRTLDVNSSNLDGIPSHVASAYQKALEMLNARADLEEQISRHDVPDTEQLQQFMVYLKFEQSSGDPSRVQSLYERAITEFPISSDLWLDYTNYLNKTLKADRTLRHIYNRATRNCPWVGELWVRYLLYLERCHTSEKEISDVFEKSLLCTFSTFDEYVDIFLTRVDGLRRRITRELDEALDYALIRDTFQRASDYLSPQLKNTYSLLQVHSYWARLESSLGKDLTAARGVWESLLKNSGSMVEAWQGYIAMEIEMGHINEARSLYKRCYSKKFPGTGSEDICNSWIRFEREYGTLEDYDHALQKILLPCIDKVVQECVRQLCRFMVTPRLQELQLFRLQQESKSVAPSTDPREDSLKKNIREKRKPVSDINDEQSPAKRQKDTAKISKTVQKKDNAEVKTSVEGNKKGNTKAQRGKPDHGDDLKTKDSRPDKSLQYNDQCTVFISNLNLTATYEDLRKFFSDIGGVVAIRILNDKFTKKSRGLAYVDFSDDAHLEAAVAKNKQELLGKRLSIARSDPTGRNRGKQNSNLEHGVQMAGVGEQTHPTGGPQTQRHDNVQLKGKNTFAVPRAVRPLGWTNTNKPRSESAKEEQETPRSNDEFRNMLLKKT